MAKENKKEVSFVEGPIFQSLIRFALPVLGALILHQPCDGFDRYDRPAHRRGQAG